MMGPFLFCVVVDGYCVVVLVLLVGGSCVIGWWDRGRGLFAGPGVVHGVTLSGYIIARA